ncbi:MAG: UDP-N-acetylmuramate dehydrogenase, partial [Bacteroidales bacterium]|nr:UDP-N-acetylmuramate dehydrogenase [Bacteroidales bacterium]
GEGSNLLFTAAYDGLVIHPVIAGIGVVDESGSEVLVRAGAGVNWDRFVQYCVSHHLYGTENLSLIPGSVGAAPVQNIGAYGVEARDIIEYVEVFDIQEMKPVILSNAACEFGYRDSIFKHNSERYIVTYVVFRLQKEGKMNLEYGNVKEEFLRREEQNLQTLRETIISIREEKLPDPSVTGNAGSFFKNPVIRLEEFKEIQKVYQDVPGYTSSPEKVKVPAAWLIDHSGWKGVREENVGTWPAQPLVIVNYGGAGGEDIFAFSEKIRAAVYNKFRIRLEREVTVVGPVPE